MKFFGTLEDFSNGGGVLLSTENGLNLVENHADSAVKPVSETKKNAKSPQEKRIDMVIKELNSMRGIIEASFKPDFLGWVSEHENLKETIGVFSHKFKEKLCQAKDVRGGWEEKFFPKNAAVCFIDAMVGLKGEERALDFDPLFSDGELDPENKNNELLRLFLRHNEDVAKFLFYNLQTLKKASDTWNKENGLVSADLLERKSSHKRKEFDLTGENLSAEESQCGFKKPSL